MTNTPRSARTPSPPATPSSCFESLLYSRRGSDKKNGTRSVARRTQELGAQLCGRLSQIALEVSSTALDSTATAAADLASATRASSSPLVSPSFAAASAPLSFMADVHRDLSAHYGSHAVRRGLAKPLGPCVHPIVRKGKFAARRAGVHSPRYMRVWIMRLVRRCWCSRCGVRLTRGGTQMLDKLNSCRTALATIKECRVRGQRQPCRWPTKRSRFMWCCLRCLDAAKRAAKRNAGLLGMAAVRQQPQRGRAATSHPGDASHPAKHVTRKAPAENLERTLRAVLAEAQVPRRNRRCRRRSQRRRRGSKEETRAGSKVTLHACSGSPTAMLQKSASASQVTQRLAISLMRKAAASTGVGGSGNSTKVSLVSVPHTARAAQKSLQGLVPSGPLRKVAPRASATAPPPPTLGKSSAAALTTCKSSATAPATAAATSSVSRFPPPLPSLPKSNAGAPAPTTDRRVYMVLDETMETIHTTGNSNAKESRPTVTVSGMGSSSADSLPPSALPGLAIPPMAATAIASCLRTRNAEKKATSPPAKTSTVTKKPVAAKKKFMDTINQLGF
ncbi:hypothetical protein LSCM1_02582 [Leishmania martiniquensis]|uniref:Uncharacterized protein n=1 Tax=Leishmania martiniquensis TaxID=1580590 RepID=A0A836GPG9_9TRYP|nr:hypothetical protein LSCM1_02582 [Leishmania martiniquensis]